MKPKVPEKAELVKRIRAGIRLNTPAPKIEKHKKLYTRKAKHKVKYA